MRTLAEIRAAARPADIAQGQLAHLAIALLMVAGAISLLPDAPGPRFLWLGAADWARLSILLAVAHQIVVALVFRFQLYTGFLSRLFGPRDLTVWGAVFFPFLVARPLTLLTVGLLSLGALTPWRWAEIGIGAAFIALAAYTMHSVLRHFTFRRALGGDHFRDEIIALPLVRKGAFRFTSNAMYSVAFLGLWGIALACGSWNALVVALFQHAYIWVHMYLIEAPDMARLYGSADSA